MQMVTGPSFTSATFISAPNSPVPTGRPMADFTAPSMVTEADDTL